MLGSARDSLVRALVSPRPQCVSFVHGWVSGYTVMIHTGPRGVMDQGAILLPLPHHGQPRRNTLAGSNVRASMPDQRVPRGSGCRRSGGQVRPFTPARVFNQTGEDTLTAIAVAMRPPACRQRIHVCSVNAFRCHVVGATMPRTPPSSSTPRPRCAAWRRTCPSLSTSRSTACSSTSRGAGLAGVIATCM